MAVKTEMVYLKPLLIFQFAYMTHEQKMKLYIDYQQVLTREKDASLETREKWLLEQLEQLDGKAFQPNEETTLSNAMEQIKTNRTTIDELKMILEQIR
ncbi:hypothetical protein P5G51_019655 [Virgibacillus sp. 179-BFC.A HS]|uniref:Uncharacterized protein n=1 Tax=Tigheibacillus jepli TaxID=3035914 RepID=A0ABU5CLN1_9BACI|nr:hypothetical protein [Virgibacillus sp. 179-BFC.A HS]MDY0407250.1 hypothetical protein [Virgibacillus sp. 179-BFC.A HS]